MTSSKSNNLNPKSDNTNLQAGTGNLDEFDVGQILQGIGGFFTGLFSGLFANIGAERNKVIYLISSMTREAQKDLFDIIERQKEVISQLKEVENDPYGSHISKESLALRRTMSKNYEKMANIISEDLPFIKNNTPGATDIAEKAISGLKQESINILSPRHRVRELRPDQSHTYNSAPDEINNQHAMNEGNSQGKSVSSSKYEEYRNVAFRNADQIHSEFKLDVKNNIAHLDIANYLMAISNDENPNEILSDSPSVQGLSRELTESYKKVISDKAESIMNLGNNNNVSSKADSGYSM